VCVCLVFYNTIIHPVGAGRSLFRLLSTSIQDFFIFFREREIIDGPNSHRRSSAILVRQTS
jgi:hypothetical protein